MKILITATVQSHICQFHRPLVEMLHAHGCEVHAAAKNNLEEKNGLKLDFVEKVYDLPFARSPKSKDNITAYRELKKIIEKEHYDIIHCNTPMGGIVTRLAARKSRKKGTQVFYTAHGFHFYKGASKKNWILFYPIEKLFSIITDKVITINHEDYALASNKFYSRTYYIHGVGVDETKYVPCNEKQKNYLKNEMGYSNNQKIILCIGELLPNKNQKMGIHVLKQMISHFPNTLLLIAGNGKEKKSLEQEAANLDLSDSVVFLGYCTNLDKYQKITDVLISCSKREGLPLNIVEAMLSGNPVVATKNRGHCELIDQGKTGYLVDIDDISTMVKYIEELFNNPTKADEMGKNARIFAEQYGTSRIKEELEKIYFNDEVK